MLATLLTVVPVCFPMALGFQEPGAVQGEVADEDPALERLRASLELVKEALEGGEDVEAARAEMQRAMSEFPSVENMSDAWMPALVELDELGGDLSMPRTQLVARERRVSWMTRRVPPEDPALLTAKQSLARTRLQLGDVDGAHELLEAVHASRERLLPPEDPDLLATMNDLAASRFRRGDLKGAQELFEGVLEVRARLLPPEHRDVLAATLNLAATRMELGDLEGAHDLFEVVHEAWERLLPGDHPDLLRAKQNLAKTSTALGDLQGAHDLYVAVHDSWERQLPRDHPELIGSKLNLAAARWRLGDLEGAHEAFESVHDAMERQLPPEDPRLLTAKQNLAVTRGQLGDLEGALELEQAVYEVRKRVLPPEHPDLLAAELNLAVTRSRLGDLEGAAELIEAVHEVRERRLPADHPDLLAVKLSLATSRKKRGDHEGALELEEAVFEVRKRVLPPDHPDLLVAQENLSVTRRRLGDLQGALDMVEEVHEKRARVLPPEHPDLLRAKLNLAVTRRGLGDFVGARELQEVVHEMWERLLPPDHPDLLAAKLTLSSTLRELGEFDDALKLGEAVCEARERLLPPEHPDMLLAKMSLARTRYHLRDTEGALELLEDVYEVQRLRLPPEHPDLLAVMVSLAKTRQQLGDLESALELMEAVHYTQVRRLPPEHSSRRYAKLILAGLRGQLGDHEGALELAHSMLASQRGTLATLQFGSQRMARAAALAELRYLSACLFMGEHLGSISTGPLDEATVSALESIRLVSTGTAEVALAARRLPELAETQERLHQVRARLSDLGLSPPLLGPELEVWRADLVNLRDERDRLEGVLRAMLVENGFSLALPSSESIARALDPNAVWISFLRYLRLADPDPFTDSLLAFVITPDGEVKRVELGACDELEALVGEWRLTLGEPVGRGGPIGSPGREEREVEAGTALREKILSPVLEAVGEELPERVHLVLDDLLHLVPVEALPWEDGKRVGDILQVRMETNTGRILSPLPPVSGEGTLLALGGVDFGAEDVEDFRPLVFTATPPTERSGTSGHFTPLRQAHFEVETLGELYEESLDEDPLVLTEAAASKAALHAHAASARYLHVATHGWFAPETIQSMRDSVGEGTELFDLLDRADRTLTGFAPETLCGLALAGANHGKNDAGRVPGILTAEELATLDLSNCELAVLSACETNVGDHSRAGQGIQSLQTALHAAGARTAVTSLWKVDDAATRKLMELFYAYLWVEKLPKAEALWKAKCDLRAAGHPVRDWGAWVLSGDPD